MDVDELHYEEDQPYETPTRIRYEKLIRQAKIDRFAKRSDIILTSTIALNLFPTDPRRISKVHFASMGEEEIREYLDSKNNFNALIKDI